MFDLKATFFEPQNVEQGISNDEVSVTDLWERILATIIDPRYLSYGRDVLFTEEFCTIFLNKCIYCYWIIVDNVISFDIHHSLFNIQYSKVFGN